LTVLKNWAPLRNLFVPPGVPSWLQASQKARKGNVWGFQGCVALLITTHRGGFEKCAAKDITKFEHSLTLP